MYARILDRAARRLEALGVDLMTCGPRELAQLGTEWDGGRSTMRQLRAALTHAWEVLERDPAPSLRAIRVPPARRSRCLALETEDAVRLERAAYDRHDLPGLAVLIGLYSGLRRSEIAGLRWEHFAAGSDGLLEWVTVTGKGDVTADVPVHPVLAEILEDWRRARGWVFPARTGKPGPVNPTTVWTWVRKVGDDAGVPVRTHILRHTALAEANDRSGDLRAVQSFARHARPETTAGYTRTTSARLRAVVSAVDYGRARQGGNDGVR